MNSTFLWSLAALSAAACCATRASMGGEVYVSAVSATDWAVYSSKYQPTFHLDEAKALSLAVVDTMQIESSVLDSRSVGVRAKVVQGEASLQDAGDVAKPGPVPAVTAAKSAIDASKLGSDPRLQYLLATALWQEVQVLNRYVLDAAVESENHIPYLVRLQVSGFPDAPSAAYVQDLTLCFESNGLAVPVVPLLVSHHVEAALASRREEELRRLSVALEAMLKGVGGAIDFDQFRGRVEQSLGREFNALLSVARSEDSQLRVRLGARRAGDGEYVAASEPRFLTVLVLFPVAESVRTSVFDANQVGPKSAAPPSVDVRYHGVRRCPVSGQVLGDQSERRFTIRAPAQQQPWLRAEQTAFAYDDGANTTVTLHDAVGFAPDRFVATWFFRNGAAPTIHAVTSHAVEIDADAKVARFRFPSLRKYGLDPQPSEVPRTFADRELFSGASLPSGDSKIDSVGRLLSVEIPGATSTSTSTSGAGLDRSFVVQLDGVTTQGKPTQIAFPWVYKASSAVPLQSGFAVIVHRTKLTQDKGKGDLAITFELPMRAGTPISGFKLLVQGAEASLKSGEDVVSVPPGSPADVLTILKPGTCRLELAGLYANARVTLTAKGPAGYAVPEPIVLDVAP